MQPITYLCFTLLSILIQFSLLDFINTNQDGDAFIDNMNSSNNYKRKIFRKIKETPHALYYQNEKNKLLEKANLIFPIKYKNTSLTEPSFLSSTEMGSTVFDWVYDDNVTILDDHFTSEIPFSTTDFDNVTEITFFDKSSTVRPTEVPKKYFNTTKCDCNLLHNICDINCCCDDDCTEKEKALFGHCKNRILNSCTNYDKYHMYLCFSDLTCKDKQISNFFQNLFCIAKMNLPERRNTKMVYSLNTTNFYSWTKDYKHQDKQIFSKEMYVAHQIVWILTNGILNVLEIPTMLTNNYCGGKKAIKYLRSEEIKCLVKLQDLHQLYILKHFEDTNVVSPSISTINNTVMNCSSFECVKWTLLVCDESNCILYNKSIHEPACSERYCSNIAAKLNYLFYCNESTITKAVIKMYVNKVSMARQVMEQEINVNFYMTNDSTDNVIQLSGNPGYVKGLPIIASYLRNNHTKCFFNNTVRGKNLISFPLNKNGVCSSSNTTENKLIFGHNKKMKCRMFLKKNIKINNGTDECQKVQEQIKELLGIRQKVFISPYGNPRGVNDENWLEVEISTNDVIYGEYRPKSSVLLCFNLVTSISFVFAFADMNRLNEHEYKILATKVEGNAANITLDMEDLSVVITIDTNFIDSTVSPMLKLPGSQYFNINKQKNYISNLVPFPSNKSYSLKSYSSIICMCLLMFKQIK